MATASTVTNGLVLEVPYAIIQNIRNARPWSLSVVGRDTRQYAYDQLQLRSLPKSNSYPVNVYVGDVITFTLQAAACNSVDAAAFDFYSVNFTNGVTTKAAEVGFNKVWQRQIVVTISAIDASSGAITFTTGWS
jgi:hypothetical protein